MSALEHWGPHTHDQGPLLLPHTLLQQAWTGQAGVKRVSRELTSASSTAETANLPVSVSKLKEKERAGLGPD